MGTLQVIGTIYYSFLIITALCIPVYLLVGKRDFALYLIFLFGGSLVQKLSSLYLYEVSPKLFTVIYDSVAVVVNVALVVFILSRYIDTSILKEKRFNIFVITSLAGIGLRMFENYNDSKVWALGVAYYITIIVLGGGFLLTIQFKEFIKQDGGILLSIIAGAIIYIGLLQFCKDIKYFYVAWLLTLGIQSLIWLTTGLRDLRKGAVGKHSPSNISPQCRPVKFTMED